MFDQGLMCFSTVSPFLCLSVLCLVHIGLWVGLVSKIRSSLIAVFIVQTKFTPLSIDKSILYFALRPSRCRSSASSSFALVMFQSFIVSASLILTVYRPKGAC